MSIFREIGRFFSERTSGPEERVNKISSFLVEVCKKDISEEQQLERLEIFARDYPSLQARYRILSDWARIGKGELSPNDLVCNYIVATGDTILALLGEDPGSGRGRTQEMREWMRQSCERQKSRVDFARVDQEKLRDALWQVFGIKSGWRILNDPRWELCSITELEVWARDEFNKAHSSC